MSLYTPQRGMPRFRQILSSFLQHDSLHFADVLPEETITAAFAEVDFARDEGDIYTPAVTLWAFLSQVLHLGAMRSCTAAVARVIVLMTVLGRKPCSGNTSAYCKARAKLPVAVLARLTTELASGCERQLPKQWLWKGHHVKLADGTTVTTADTPDNQKAFPQPNTQAKGLGFPMIRLVVLVSLATAMVGGMALGPYQGKMTGETALLRELFGHFNPGDILLADRYYCSYFMIALLQTKNVAVVSRLHQRRHYDFSRGRQLGTGDHVVCWSKPQRPSWMDQDTYEQMPESLHMREVQVHVKQPGFRTQSLVVVTTLLDAEHYSQDDLAELYHQRWLIELDIRSLKITMGMDELRCQSPDMVRREIWTCLLGYNLIRKMMLEAAHQSKLSPRQLSFTAALQMIVAAWAVAATAAEPLLLSLSETLLGEMAKNKVGDRPNRVEPRKVKRRPKPHPLLTEPRAQARAKLYQNSAA